MIKRFIFFIALLFCVPLCRAQQGCFKEVPGPGLELQTNAGLHSSNVFFVGELHGVYGVPEIKLTLIKYLNKNFGITDVFMEMGYSAAYLYNSYLATGDTAFICRPMLVNGAKKPDVDFWKGLYIYNKGIKRGITIHGMDFERAEFIKVLKFLMPLAHEIPKQIWPTIHYIDTVHMPEIGPLYSGAFNSQDSIYLRIREEMKNNRAIYEAYYGDDFNTVQQIMFNVCTYADFHLRNNAMYQNILKQVEQDSIKKFVIFAGLAHGNKEHKGSLCGLLLNNERYSNTLTDIAMTCKNCYSWQQPQNGIVPYKAPYTYFKDTLLMDSIYERYFTTGCKYTLIPAGVVDGAVVRKYSDYIILMKDQPEY